MGAASGPISGTAILLEQLIEELKEYPEVHFTLSDTMVFKSGNLFYKLFFTLRAIWRTFRSDVTSVHLSYNGVLYIAPLFLFCARLFRRKFHFRKFGGQFHRYYEDSKGLRKKLVKYILSKSDLSYFETDHLVGYFKEKFPQSNILHYQNSRKRPNFEFTLKRPRTGKFLFVGSVIPSKGVLTILEASGQLPDCEFHFYGLLGNEISKDQINRNPNCFYRGSVKADEIQKVMLGYDCLLLPSYYAGEGYPGVLLESYSIGVPVVVSNWQALPELVEEGKTGYLVEPKASGSLVDKITHFRNLSDDQLNKMRESCLEVFNSKFVSTVLTEKFVHDMKMLCGPKSIRKTE
ncbi:MAG: glycosyltransferase family 4 protein [Pirellulaceae bacterium]|nr:glycosyltransferase family 4 protein [Pirellulaceae bacterium]